MPRGEGWFVKRIRPPHPTSSLSPENVRTVPWRLFVERNRRWNSSVQLPLPLGGERAALSTRCFVKKQKVSTDGYLAIGRPKNPTRADKVISTFP
jgi:hypothetical protein